MGGARGETGLWGGPIRRGVRAAVEWGRRRVPTLTRREHGLAAVLLEEATGLGLQRAVRMTERGLPTLPCHAHLEIVRVDGASMLQHRRRTGVGDCAGE